MARSKCYRGMTGGRGWKRVTLKKVLKISATSSKSFTEMATAWLTAVSLKKLSNLLTGF